ncbi:hypothetical protein BX600DRAFT_436305 [Xylariales sp. PMI_506]|nr:hypothetical protein BX600DRAFT_436305 [Xylariales sp. PMI_506]
MAASDPTPTGRLAIDNAENWLGLADARSRRRIQNRLNQRASRQRRLAASPQSWPDQNVTASDGGSKSGAVLHSSRGRVTSELHQQDQSYAVAPRHPFATQDPTPPSIEKQIWSLSSISPELQTPAARQLFEHAFVKYWKIGFPRGHGNLLGETVGLALCRTAIAEPTFMGFTLWTQALFFDSIEVRSIGYAAQIRVIAAVRKALSQGTVTNAMIACVAGFNAHTIPQSDSRLRIPPLGLFESLDIEKLGGLKESGDIVPDLKHFRAYKSLLQLHAHMVHRDSGLAEFHTRTNIRGSALDFDPPALPLCHSYQTVHQQDMVPNRPPRDAVDLFTVDDEFKDILLDLKYTLQVLEEYLVDREARREPHPGPFVSYRDIVQHGIYSLPLRQISASQRASTEVCRLAVLVFALGVTQPHPLRSVHRRAVRQLFLAMRDPKQIENQSAGFLFWAAIVGGLGAGIQDPAVATAAAFYRSTVAALSTELKLRTWNDAKLLLQGFLWFERSCDKGGRILWENALKTRNYGHEEQWNY